MDEKLKRVDAIEHRCICLDCDFEKVPTKNDKEVWDSGVKHALREHHNIEIISKRTTTLYK